MPRPPPTSTEVICSPSARRSRMVARALAAAEGSVLRICEPMYADPQGGGICASLKLCKPRAPGGCRSRTCVRAVRLRCRGASRRNVGIYAHNTGALPQLACALGQQLKFACASTLKMRMESRAGRSRRRLAHPENTTRCAAALFTRRMRPNSPPETMSKPAPFWSSKLRIASAEFALTE